MMISDTEAFPTRRDGEAGSILLDSGSDEHMCPSWWHKGADTVQTVQGLGPLRDVQGNIIEEKGRRWITSTYQGWNADTWEPVSTVKSTSCYTIGEVRKPLLSAGKIVEAGGVIHLEKGNSFMQIGDACVPVNMQGRSFVVSPEKTVAVGGVDGGTASSSAAGYVSSTYGPQYDLPDSSLGWTPAPLPRWQEYGLVAAGERAENLQDEDAFLPDDDEMGDGAARQQAADLGSMD